MRLHTPVMKRQHMTPTGDMGSDLIEALLCIRKQLSRPWATDLWDAEAQEALATVETFCAISLRIIAKTNPSKVRSEAVSVEIQSLLKPSQIKKVLS